MTPNKRDLKAYSRFDGTGRIVPGSTVLRRQKPKVGNWKEVQAYECCNQDQQTIQVNIQSEFPFNYPDFVVESDDMSPYIYFFNSADNTTVNDVVELAAYNNTRYGAIGKFTASGENLLFTPSVTIAAIFAANGTNVIAAFSFSD
jgi:hypothetical protein